MHVHHHHPFLVSVSCELSRGLLVHLGRLGRLPNLLPRRLLALVVRRALDFSALLEPGNNILVLPAELVSKTTDGAVFATWLQSEDTESLWNDHSLLVVIWWWDALERL